VAASSAVGAHVRLDIGSGVRSRSWRPGSRARWSPSRGSSWYSAGSTVG